MCDVLNGVTQAVCVVIRRIDTPACTGKPGNTPVYVTQNHILQSKFRKTDTVEKLPFTSTCSLSNSQILPLLDIQCVAPMTINLLTGIPTILAFFVNFFKPVNPEHTHQSTHTSALDLPVTPLFFCLHLFLDYALYNLVQPRARAVRTLPAVTRSTQPSTVRGMVNEYRLSG